jgi:hypothetical protein
LPNRTWKHRQAASFLRKICHFVSTDQLQAPPGLRPKYPGRRHTPGDKGFFSRINNQAMTPFGNSMTPFGNSRFLDFERLPMFSSRGNALLPTKWNTCALCRRPGFLICHGLVYGNDTTGDWRSPPGVFQRNHESPYDPLGILYYRPIPHSP